ncbi:MAG: hypothetical protein AB7F86_00850 [Bdellovibrionales bacterium]
MRKLRQGQLVGLMAVLILLVGFQNCARRSASDGQMDQNQVQGVDNDSFVLYCHGWTGPTLVQLHLLFANGLYELRVSFADFPGLPTDFTVVRDSTDFTSITGASATSISLQAVSFSDDRKVAQVSALLNGVAQSISLNCN